MFGSGPHLRGAAEEAGFAGAMETMAKATLVKVAVETAIPMAADKLTKLCPHRRPPDAAANALPILDAPSPSSPFQKVVDKQQQDHTTKDPIDNDLTIDNDKGNIIIIIATTNANAVLRLDLEVKFIIENERAKWIDMLDEAMIAIIDEQRIESTRHDDKLDDPRRIITKRHEDIYEQLTTLMEYMETNKVDSPNTQMQVETITSDNATATDRLVTRDVNDGQPTAWAEAISEGDRITTKQAVVETIPINTFDQEADAELKDLLTKWIRAKIRELSLIIPPQEIINGLIINNFDSKVMQRIGSKTGFTETTREQENTNKLSDDIDFNRVATDNIDNGYSTPPPPPWSQPPSEPTPGGLGGSGGGHINNLNLGSCGPNEPNGGDFSYYGGQNRFRDNNNDRNDGEFRLVNPRNITVSIFNGKNLATNPYMALNTSIRRLIVTQGAEGEALIKILDYVETLGAKQFIDSHLTNLKRQCNKVGEFDRAVKSALLNWAAGFAQGIVKYGIEGAGARRLAYAM